MAHLRWGVLGTASIALRKVIPALQRAAGCEVLAIASRDGAKAAAAAGALGIPRAYGSYDSLLADAEVDAVYIPLPNHLHVPWSIRAAEAGKHVLCEKPIALDAAEARRLLPVRERTGVCMAEAFMVRVHPQWLAARELVESGRIGQLRLVTGHFSYNKRDPADIRSRPEYGGGALMDIGCYLVTLSRWLFRQQPERVVALLDRDPELGIDRLTSVLLQYREGQAAFSCATQLAAHQRVQVLGTAARIEVEVPFNAPRDRACRILVDDGRDPFGGGVQVLEFPVVDQFTLQAEQFERAVRAGEPVPVPLEDSIASMEVLDAIVRSAATGRWETP